MLHSCFLFPRKVQVLILLFDFFQCYSVVSRYSKVIIIIIIIIIILLSASFTHQF